jgi:dolichol-phosphate mannosyltransferase
VHAVKIGFQYVTGDCFMMLAADGQDPPEMIVAMADCWLAGSKYTVCARGGRGDPITNRLFSNLYYRLVRLYVAKDYPSTGYDLALMDKAMLGYLQASAKNINTPLFAYWLGFKPTVLTYERRKRVHGKSRWSFYQAFQVHARFTAGLLNPADPDDFADRNQRVYPQFRVRRDCSRNSPPRWAGRSWLGKHGSADLFPARLAIVMLGVIGEYVWRIFDEVSRRPEAVIEEVR